ncbi:zinc finger FYVE domain-containing protein 9 isoform X1 [Hippoglossus hippoglossus]|uniref:zinc finger FYVE domain-containing protein 9 isoform X1 n=1 Tax=Hippoglossus hippoglossus TaxID=8267 RepID=UPI00148D17DE|nr:zinc finger FYVE domain-containing protein 9 isoform X1 [Hippoglossus hippoglossus]
MLKFFSARDDENESLLGAITEDEGDNPSLQDTKHHWLNRPCLLVLKDGDVSKPGLGCGQIRAESPSKATSDATVRTTLVPCEQKPSEHLAKTVSPSQLEEGSCTVTAISSWGESRFGESASPLVLSPAEAAWPEEGAELVEEGKKPQALLSKEDSVVEEKELEESGQQQEQPCSSEATATPEEACGIVSWELPGQFKKTTSNGRDEENTSWEGAVGDSASSCEDPDNESQLSPAGILSKDRGSVLGEVAPVWIPDAQAQVCMKCGVKFTFTKRRHHCRACGKVFCALCSNLKFRLTHLDGKEGRVCVCCHSTLIKRTPPRGKRRVWFADEILTNKRSESAPTTPVRGPTFSPLTRRALGEPVKSPVGSPQIRRATRPDGTSISEACGPYGWGTTALVSSSANLIPLEGLPPILTSTGVKGDYTVEEQPSEMLLIQELESGRPKPLVFVLNANLLAMVKLVNYVNRKCWCVTTKGMHAVGQVEVVVLLQCLPEEKSFPKDIFSHFIQLYRDMLTGKVVQHLSLSLFGSSFLGSEEHAGFLYVHSTLQSLQGLPLPNQPYLFGLLVHRAEVAWAKAFPLRLMLRLGAEYRFYPCPLYSVRCRKPLFGEIGHTIMRLLVDFRNYRYSLPVVPGLTVDLEAQRTCIKIPTTGYNELMKALNKSNEHVLAIAACFNEAADSHLICVQADGGQYQTQAISIHNQPRKVTGSCFFIFSSALKASAGYLAKSSIVEDCVSRRVYVLMYECMCVCVCVCVSPLVSVCVFLPYRCPLSSDGLMVQITVETMAELRRSLREMKDYTVTCGRLDQSDSQELVCVQWVEERCTVNKGVISPIDGKSMESISSTKMFQKSEYKENGKIIRWTEVFFLQTGDDPKGGASDSAEHNRLTERIARAFCLALCPHLKLLKEDGMAKLGLRVTFDPQEVGFVAGSNGQPLPARYLNALDSVMIPVIHSRGRKRGDEPIVMELIFYILENIT